MKGAQTGKLVSITGRSIGLAVAAVGLLLTSAMVPIGCQTLGPADAMGVPDSQGDMGTQGPAGDMGATGSQGPAGPQGEQGPPGVPGPAGADGQLRIYGDGSAGAKLIDASTTLAEANTQYTDFTVNAGVTLTIPSGTIIRCTGAFTNDGTIVVQTGARGGTQDATAANPVNAYQPADAGVALSTAAPGEIGGGSELLSGGVAGVGVGAGIAAALLHPGHKAGGGGGGRILGIGGHGGGSLTVRAMGAIMNGGLISADGDTPTATCGGGAGGIVILASPTSIANTGMVSARGGDGGDSWQAGGPGAGGGGGIIHLLSPAATQGATDVAGGASGAVGAAGSVMNSTRQGGGGGGGCGGNGGTGGGVLAGANGTPFAGVPSQPGIVLITNANPTALF